MAVPLIECQSFAWASVCALRRGEGSLSWQYLPLWL